MLCYFYECGSQSLGSLTCKGREKVNVIMDGVGGEVWLQGALWEWLSFSP